MLFSKLKWNDAEEIQPYLQASSALSFQKCASSFQQAEDKYLQTMLGAAMLRRAIEAYNNDARTDAEQSLVAILQDAEANLAFADNFDEFQIRLTDQGIQRQETDKFKQAYRYQEKNMQRIYLNRGLNRLERAMAFLDEHVEEFPEWASSAYCLERKKLIVRSTIEIGSLYFIHDSAIIYMRLSPYFRQLTDLNLPKILGKELCKKFLQALESNSVYVDDESTAISTEQLRLSCVKYLVFAALAKLVRETGNITDRGLYFTTQHAVSVNPDEEAPGTRSQIAALAASLDDSAYRYSTALQGIVADFFPTYFGGHDCDVYKRDNHHKRSVWL